MIAELITGLGAVAVSFFLLLSLCIVVGRAAGYFSRHKDNE